MCDCRTFWVATVHTSNRPHVMPVWGVWVDDAFYFSTGRKSRKGRNVAANPACTVTNDDGEEAVIVEGSAVEVGAAKVRPQDPIPLGRVELVGHGQVAAAGVVEQQ